MKLLSVFVIVFIAKISAIPAKTSTESTKTTAAKTTTNSSVENFSTFIDHVSGSSSVPVSNVITTASLVVDPATAALVAAKNSASVTGPYKIISKVIVDVNLALTSGSAIKIFLNLFSSMIGIFATARFQTNGEISLAYAVIPQSYGFGITYFQNLLNISSGVGLLSTQVPNLIVNSVVELRNAVYNTILALQKFVSLVLDNPNPYLVQAVNALAITQLSGMNAMVQSFARLAAIFPSLVVVQDAIGAAMEFMSNGIRGLTVVVTQISAALQSVAVDQELIESAQSFSNILNDSVRSFAGDA